MGGERYAQWKQVHFLTADGSAIEISRALIFTGSGWHRKSEKKGKRMAAKEKILVVDDEPSIRKYLQTLLEVDGFEVETVSSGKEALTKVSKGDRPDFIILDVLMPELSGLDTLKELMQVDRSLNVIMLSCSNEVGTVVEAIPIGAHDYLTKPFEKSELDAAMLKSRQKKQLTTENQALRDYCDPVTQDLSFLAASPWL